MTAPATYDDVKLPVRVKLSALWASVTLCYLYGDYFGLYKPGKLQGMLNGQSGQLGPITQGTLLGTAVLMAIPCVMVFLSLALPPRADRWANIVLGSVFTLVMLVTMTRAWAFYRFLGAVEVALTGAIVWHAWHWPRGTAA
jgi:hypothetical protein